MCKSVTYIQFCFKNLQSHILQSQILQSQIHANVKTVQEERAHAELKISLAVNVVAATIMTAKNLYQQVNY